MQILFLSLENQNLAWRLQGTSANFKKLVFGLLNLNEELKATAWYLQPSIDYNLLKQGLSQWGGGLGAASPHGDHLSGILFSCQIFAI